MYFGGSFTWDDFEFLLWGAKNTISITLVAVLIGTCLGVLFGLIRAGSPWWISNTTGAILDVFRSVPLLIQLVLFNSFNSMLRLNCPTFAVGCVALGVYASFLYGDRQKRRGGGPADDAASGSISRSHLVSGTAVDHPADRHTDCLSQLDRPRPRRDEGHGTRAVDRHRRAAAKFADRHIPRTGAAPDPVRGGPDLLPYEFPDCQAWRQTRKKVEREMIAIENVHKYFGSLHVLDGVNLSVQTSEVLSMIGGSGSGKSTMLMCINGLEGI